MARERFGWKPRCGVVPLCGLFLVVDLAFFGATLFKIPDGGWFPLVVGAIVLHHAHHLAHRARHRPRAAASDSGSR